MSLLSQIITLAGCERLSFLHLTKINAACAACPSVPEVKRVGAVVPRLGPAEASGDFVGPPAQQFSKLRQPLVGHLRSDRRNADCRDYPAGGIEHGSRQASASHFVFFQ